MLLGREHELARVEALLDDARRGRSSTLLLIGEPGIGKTALLEAARSSARGMTCLSATGVEPEHEIPFASLHELVRPVLGLLDRVPAAQAAAIEAALALREGEPDALAVSAGTLSLLVEAAATRPLLVVLDDAHWLDDASGRVLAFTARRVAGESIAFLIAARQGERHPFTDTTAHVLAPLGVTDALTLVRARPRPVDAAAESRVVEAAQGNPLALLEIPEELVDRLPRSATTDERLQRAFAPRLETLTGSARTALLLATMEPELGAVERSAVALDLGNALEEVLQAGLVRVVDRQLVFRHPVVRSLVYGSADPALRRQAHAALADALVDAPDLDRRVWHRAAAADGPDEEVAGLLEDVAKRASGRGAHAAAAGALERAADLTPRPAEAARRFHDASRATFWAGDAGAALQLARRGFAIADDTQLRADLLCQLAAIGAWNGWHVPEELFHEALAAEGLDDVRTSRLLYELVERRLSALDAEGAVALAPRLEEAARRAGPWWQPRHLAEAGAAYLLGGNREHAEELFREVAADAAPTAGYAFDFMHLEWHDILRRALDESLETSRAEDHLLRITWCQIGHAHLGLRQGRLSAASTAAAEAMALAETIGTPALGGAAACALAGVHAWRGQDAALSEHAEHALRSAREAKDRYQEMLAHGVLALGSLGRGQLEDVVSELEPLARERLATPGWEPANLAFVPLLVEGLAQLGEGDTARSWLDRFEPVARHSTRHWAIAAVERCEGLLAPGDPDAFAPPLERAVTGFTEGGAALEAARTRLLLGERLRRAGRQRDARSHLRDAYRAFATVSAEPWAARAAAELRATGERVADREAPLPELTPQEQNIARLVAEGRTNKEIAAALFLSPKTIEYHLAGTFRKLNIHSRAELARLVSRTE